MPTLMFYMSVRYRNIHYKIHHNFSRLALSTHQSEPSDQKPYLTQQNQQRRNIMKYTRLFENIDERVPINGKLSQDEFVELLAKNKALLIRPDENESVSVEDFASFMSHLDLEAYPYVGGAAPRRIIPVNVPGGEDMVYTANEAPPDTLIPFHHELAQTQNPPQYIFFYCEQPSETGGETALIDSTLVYRFANDNFPEFMDKLKKYG